jgi:peptide/nickel transport system substrate-binding protein
MGLKQFALTPVGAGPFKVVTDNPNAELVVKKNPHYFEQGKPYLNEIDFKVVGTDNSALDAMQTGGGDVYQFFGSPQLLASARKSVRVLTFPPSAPLDVQLNTSIPPFNNILAREAVTYAIDQNAMSKALSYGTGVVTDSPAGPASLVWLQKIAGYPSYNLAKAKALVKQLGGLSFTYDGGSLGSGELVSAALVADWKRAGMNVSLNNLNTLQAILEAFTSNKWEAIGQGVGGPNPAVGAGSLGWRYLSTGPFTGVHDPTLDAMINQATSTVNLNQQKAIYKRIFTYIAQKAYTPLLFETPGWNLAVKSAHGPGIDSIKESVSPLWQDAWMSSS